jgi:S-DNA-T family DNA segregation ATPase FtsK/SpoIIIE
MTLISRAAPQRVLHITLPRPPHQNETHPFPWLATVAPVVGAVGLWAITDSIYALVFAALGPIIAVASIGDSRLGARRSRRRERARFARELHSASEAITAAHEQERGDLSRIAPGDRSLVAAPGSDPERWRGSFTDPVLVRLGEGTVPSAVVLDGGVDPDDWAAPQLEAVRAASTTIAAAPVLVDARLGIGLYGPRPLVLAAARAIVVQLAAQFSPVATHIDVPPRTEGKGSSDRDWQWVTSLPHETSVRATDTLSPPGCDRVLLVESSDRPTAGSPGVGSAPATLMVAIAPTADELPRHTRVVVSVAAERSAIVRHPDPELCGAVVSDYVSDRDATTWARSQSLVARREGFAARAGNPPASATLREVLDVVRVTTEEQPETTLRCPIGIGGGGAVFVDLVEDGPHAIVGGTTGSGKSELLISWVLAMAASRSPSAVSFLFVDFKGGSAFEPLRHLPHSVGMITDLDAHTANRALSSLKAEVRHRERALTAAGVRSVDEWGSGSTLARLVIVVDEYAAMLDEHPGLHTLFMDLAARGRSLGIHLVLCTQRPGGVVRDSILANCGLRLCLRVNNNQDSIGVVGTSAAAALPILPRGRAVLRIHGGASTLVQVAHTAPADITTVSAPWTDHPRPRPPWRPPLPTVVHLASLEQASAANTIPFALVDYPTEQRQDVARFDPAQHGNLLVIGAGGSGKTTLLDTFAAASTLLRVDRVPPSLPALWDAARAALAEDDHARVLLIDDLDATVLACPEEYNLALVDLLTRLLREGPSRGVTTVLTAQRIPGPLSVLAALCESPLLLRTASRQEHVLAGGDSAHWQPDLPAGSGMWRGHRLQIAFAPDSDRRPGTSPSGTPRRARAAAAAAVTPDAGTPLAVVSTRPHDIAKHLGQRWPGRMVLHLSNTIADPSALMISRPGAAPIIIGDPEAWHSRWGALAALRESTDLLFDGCSVSEFRALTGSRDIPPPCERGSRPLWLLRRDGSVHRGSLAAPATLDGTVESAPISGITD